MERRKLQPVAQSTGGDDGILDAHVKLKEPRTSGLLTKFRVEVTPNQTDKSQLPAGLVGGFAGETCVCGEESYITPPF